MRIVHICLSAPYVDNWGYQENLLPEYLSKFGTENHVITSNDNHPDYLNTEARNEIIAKGDKYKIGNVTIHKIKCKKITSSVFIPHGLKKKLNDITPDVIFHHNVSITTQPIVSKYAKKHNCKLFVDNHADEINMSKNRLWVLLYYKGISRLACHIRRKAYTKFFGVTNSRCEFINKYFAVPKLLIELLPIGADTDLAETILTKDELRSKYGFKENDKIIITGGKMGVYKGTLDLINAIEELKTKNNTKNNTKLILFGKFEDEETLEHAKSRDFITIAGWCDRKKTLELLKLSDVACWPIHHTTLIEDSIAVETPIVIRRTGTTEHLIDGNGCWLKDGNKEDIVASLNNLLFRDNTKMEELQASCMKMRDRLSYNNISKRIIDYIQK